MQGGWFTYARTHKNKQFIFTGFNDEKQNSKNKNVD